MFSVFSFVLLVLPYWMGADACDGHKLHVKEFQNCGSKSIIKLDNFNISLTPECTVKTSGCMINSKEIHAANITYKFMRNHIPITGKKDGCKALTSAGKEAFAVLQLLALPTSCPIKEGKVCNDKAIDISKYKKYLPLMVGDIQATVKMESDAGETCIQFRGSMSKGFTPKLLLNGK